MTHNVFFYEKKDLCLCSMILKISVHDIWVEAAGCQQLPGECTALGCPGTPNAFSYAVSSALVGTYLYPWVKRSN